MKNRSLLPLILSLCLALVGLAGCGNGSQPTAAPGTGTVTGTIFVPAGTVGSVRTASSALTAPAGLIPLAGATVTISGSPHFTMVTGADGAFGFGGVPRGDQLLVVTKAGYQTQTIIVNVRSGQTSNVGPESGIRMAPANPGTLVVVAQTPGGVSIQADVTLNGVGTGLKTPYTMGNIPAGQHNISVSLAGYQDPGPRLVTLSSDQILTTTFTLTPLANQPPQVSILVPTQGQTVVRGVNLLLTGSAVDAEEGVLSGSQLVWTSSVDGQLGTGVFLGVNNLTLGAHTITLVATDSRGLTAQATAQLTVVVPPNNAPTAGILTPQQGQSFVQGAAVTFSGTGADVEDGLLTGNNLVWTSDKDGALGSGSPLILNTLTIGTHVITMRVTDSASATGQDTRTITVRSAQNQIPTATILTPIANQQIALGATVTFSGTGLDPEDGILTGSKLVWSSNLQGQLGTGATLTRNDLQLGAHTITLTVTDNNNGSGSVTRNITIAQSNNTPPTATIATPGDNATVTAGSTVVFSGTGLDQEDGALTGDRLVWTSSKDGTLGTGLSVNKNNLSIGSHTITLTVVDSGNLSGTASRTLTVNAATNTAPTATIVSPVNNQEAAQGTPVVFSGAGTDTQEGVLDGSRLTWTSSIDGALGTGNTFLKTNLSAGTHTITLKARDADGLEGTAIRTLVVSNTANNRPTATILLPQDNQSADRGSVVLFAGTGVDVEDGVLAAGNLVWTSSIDGQIGTGAQFTSLTLSSGTHTITLKATDSGGRENTATRTLIINSPLGVNPVVTILNPIQGATTTAGQPVLLSGTALDPQDGALTGARLVWSSNLQGQLGTGGALVATNLQAGTHTLTLTATDNNGNTGTATRVLVVNAAQ